MIHRVEGCWNPRNRTHNNAPGRLEYLFNQGRDEILVFNDQYSDPLERSCHGAFLTLLSSPSRRPVGQILWVGRDDNSTMEAAVDRLQLCLTLQFKTNAAFNEFRAKAGVSKAIDLWSTFLLPGELELRRPFTGDAPGNPDSSPGDRQSAVFGGVGRQLVNGQRDKQSGLGLQHHRRSADLQSAVANPMRRQLGRDQLM